MFISRYTSLLGPLTMASDGEALTGLWFDGQAHFGAGLPEIREEKDDLPVFDLTQRWLDAYFAGKEPDFNVPVRVCGSPFRLAVLDVLRTIPYGQTRSYGEVAAAVAAKTGKRACARAVGFAVARNPVSILIPCHRVVASDGGLTGYAAGLDRKSALLTLERGSISAI